MFKTSRTVGQLAEELSGEVPLIREQLQQVAEDAGRSFSRLEDAATAATALLVVLTVAVVAALFLSTVCVVAIRRQPL
jgi:pilus assembly protein TadC